MVIFSIPPLTSREYFSDNGLALRSEIFCLYLLRYSLRDSFLLIGVGEYCGAVLGSRVPSLSIQGCRIMGAIEELDQFCIGYFGGIKFNTNGFCMVSCTTTDELVSWICDERISACVSYLCR